MQEGATRLILSFKVYNVGIGALGPLSTMVYEVTMPTGRDETWIHQNHMITYPASFMMDFIYAYLLSPGSILVAVVTVVFLVNGSWPLRQKQNKIANLVESHTESSGDLSVSKEPEVPEGWYRSQEVFELERRALFSKVIKNPLNNH